MDTIPVIRPATNTPSKIKIEESMGGIIPVIRPAPSKIKIEESMNGMIPVIRPAINIATTMDNVVVNADDFIPVIRPATMFRFEKKETK